MAGVLVDFTQGEIALTAATPKTVIQVKNAANHRFKVLGWGISFDGISGTAEPVVVEFAHADSDGTMTPLTGIKKDTSLPETVQTSGLHTATAEPTTITVLKKVEVHPQGGYEWIAPFGQEYQGGASSAGGTTGRFAIRVTAPANVNCCAYISIEE